MKRFMYWWPWGVTRPWLPRVFRGSDEWHNKSVAIVLPLLGCIIFFWEHKFSRYGLPHDERNLTVDGCQMCIEIKQAIDEERR